MRRPRHLIRELLIALSIVGVSFALILPGTRRSNCGGNTAALSKVIQYRDLFLREAVESNPSPAASIADLVRAASPGSRDTLDAITRGPWNAGARFLVARAPLQNEPKGARRVVIVCDQPYQNVPQRLLSQWLNEPTHTAGFADGSIERISTAEFARLDRTRYVFLDEVLTEIGPKLATEPAR